MNKLQEQNIADALERAGITLGTKIHLTSKKREWLQAEVTALGNGPAQADYVGLRLKGNVLCAPGHARQTEILASLWDICSELVENPQIAVHIPLKLRNAICDRIIELNRILDFNDPIFQMRGEKEL